MYHGPQVGGLWMHADVPVLPELGQLPICCSERSVYVSDVGKLDVLGCVSWGWGVNVWFMRTGVFIRKSRRNNL